VQRDPERRAREPGTRGPSLHEHLLSQLHVDRCSESEQAVAEYIIGCIDDTGYLTCSVQELSAELGAPQVLVERVLQRIQTYDPPGVGARDLTECLRLQLDYLGVGHDELVWALVSSYLEDLAAGRLKSIAAELGVDVLAVQQAADQVRLLHPRPGLMFQNDDISYVTPDVIVERVGGEYVIIINDFHLPRLTLSPYYRRLLATSADPEAREYLRDRMNAAVWLLRSIEQRRRTIYRVMESIVAHQLDFFNYGTRYLRPLTLRQVGDELGLHESTISRATARKYVQTPHGIFPIRLFFHGGVSDITGTNVSSESIKLMLRDLVANEDPRRPLSDQKLSELLAARGIAISRRTVTKYREDTGIPASTRRRRY